MKLKTVIYSLLL